MSKITLFMALAATGASTLTLEGWSGQLISLGGYGLLLVLLLTRRLVTRGELDDTRVDRDAWRETAETERQARVQAEQASAATIEQGQLTVEILQDLRERAQREDYLREHNSRPGTNSGGPGSIREITP